MKYVCLNCGSDFVSKKGCKSRTPKFCSQKCSGSFNGAKADVKLKMSIAKIGKVTWNKGVKMWDERPHPKGTLGMKFPGRKFTDEWRENLSKSHKGKKRPHCSGEKSRFWKGGVTKPNEAARKTVEYREWRLAVFERDGKRCVRCGDANRYLHAHHIKPFAEHPELRLDVSNGETICIDCHSIEHGKSFHVKCASLCMECSKRIKKGAKRCLECSNKNRKQMALNNKRETNEKCSLKRATKEEIDLKKAKAEIQAVAP